MWDSRSLILSFPFFWRYTGLDPSICVTLTSPSSQSGNRKYPNLEGERGLFSLTIDCWTRTMRLLDP